jgi:gluconokinase
MRSGADLPDLPSGGGIVTDRTAAGARLRVVPGQAVGPLVLAVDVGSTASRGGVYDAAGRPVAGLSHKIEHVFHTAGDGTSEMDPDQVVDELARILSALVAEPLPGRLGGVALDTFASSLVGVGADGRAVTACYTYADARCGAQVTALRRELDEARVQQRTGCRLHSSYLPARLRWLREADPSRFAAAGRWMSLGEYAYLRLTGTTAAGTSVAAWTGLLDRRTGRWDDELLRAAGVDASQLSEVRDPDCPLDDPAGAADRWPALAGGRWFAPIADGFASNLGAGAVDSTTAAVSAATSGAIRVLVRDIPDRIPSGLWCYRVDSQRSLLGGAVNDVGRVLSWLEDTVQLGGAHTDGLLAAAPEDATPLVLPYLTGERSTGWAADARAVLVGVSAATTGPQLYRAAMEGVALSFQRILGELRATAADPHRIVASGRVTQAVPGWLQVLADALDAPVIPATIKRATLHGTALHALDILAPDAERAAVPTGDTLQPQPEHRKYFRDRIDQYDRLYRAVIAPDEPSPDRPDVR